MKKRQQLIIALFAFTFIGVAFASYPFLASLAPSKKAEAEIPKFIIEGMKKGSFKIVDHPRFGEFFNGYNYSIMLVKRNSGEINAWRLLVKDGAVGMPDYHWWRVYFSCKNFGPTLVNGTIDESKPIACHETTESLSGYKEIWQWTIDGKALNENVSDMEKTKGFVDGRYFVLGRKR